MSRARAGAGAGKKRRPKPTDRSLSRPHLNWQLDADYLEKLSPEDRAFYETFTGEYYRNATRTDLLDRETKRERWRAEVANRRDLTTRHGVNTETSGATEYYSFEKTRRGKPEGEDGRIAEIDQADAEFRVKSEED